MKYLHFFNTQSKHRSQTILDGDNLLKITILSDGTIIKMIMKHQSLFLLYLFANVRQNRVLHIFFNNV